jgi:hypothetical protein
MGLGAEEWVLNGDCGQGWVVPLLQWRNRTTADFWMLDARLDGGSLELEVPFCVFVEQVVGVRVAFCQSELVRADRRQANRGETCSRGQKKLF